MVSVLLSADCFAFFVSGVGLLSGFLSPSSPDPCLVFVCVPSFCVWLVSSTPCFSLSLSQALGKPKPIWFGFPLVFSSSCTRSPSTTRTLTSARTSRHCPAPVFFFFRRRRSVSGRCLLVLVLSVSVFLVGVFSLSLVSGWCPWLLSWSFLFALHARCH